MFTHINNWATVGLPTAQAKWRGVRKSRELIVELIWAADLQWANKMITERKSFLHIVSHICSINGALEGNGLRNSPASYLARIQADFTSLNDTKTSLKQKKK